MASSSVSQEDVENDFEFISRRSRIRSARARLSSNVSRMEANVEGDGDGAPELKITSEACSNTLVAEHDMSPKPLGRTKEKRTSRGPPARQPLSDHINRTNHLSKGKQQRDRRKLREKRRSTGVVHLQSTESTGGSTGEDEDEETKKNTLQNEQLVDDWSSAKVLQQPFRTKSQSDLDADDEDNQNQSDSTVSSLVQIVEPSKDQRSATPTGQTLEEQLERMKEENARLLKLLDEKEKLIVWMETQMQTAHEEANLEKMRLKEEVARLMRAMASLKAN